MRWILPILGVCLLLGLPVPAARADVIVLKGNDVPLTGRIIKEEEGYIRFQIKGLSQGSFVDIDRTKIDRFWREVNTYWEYQSAERERLATIERLGTPGAEAEPGAADPTAPVATERKTGPEPGPEAAMPLPAGGSRGRSDVEIRRDYLQRVVDRVASVVPRHPALRLAGFGVAYLLVTLLLFVGSRVADLPDLKFGRAAILALCTVFFVVLAFLAGRRAMLPESFPLVVAGEVMTWVLLARMLGNGNVSKSVLLLSFFLASIFLAGATLFGVLAAI